MNARVDWWLRRALAVSVLLNCALLACWLGGVSRPAFQLPDSAKEKGAKNAGNGSGIENTQSRVVAEGFSGDIRAILRGHRGLIRECAYSPNGSLLVAATDHGYLSIWDVGSSFVRLVAEHNPDSLGITVDRGQYITWVLSFAPNGRSLAYSCFGHEHGRYKIHVLDLASGLRRDIQFDEPVAMKGRLPHAVCIGLAFSPDGKTLAAGSRNGIDFFDAASGRSRGFVSDDKHFYYSKLAYPSRDSTRLFSSSLAWEIQVFDLESRKKLRGFTLPKTLGAQGFDRLGSHNFVNLILSSDGSHLAVSTSTNCVFLWDLQRGEVVAALAEGDSGWSEGSCFIRFTPDGKSLLTASRGLKQTNKKFCRRRDTETGELLYQMEIIQLGDPFPEVYPAAFSPDGRSLVCQGTSEGNQEGVVPESYLVLYDLGSLFGRPGNRESNAE